MAVTRIVPDFESRALAETTAFYVEVLGLEVVMDMGWIVTLAEPLLNHRSAVFAAYAQVT